MGILESMNIGSNALRAHGLRLDIHAKNIANIDTPNYVRRIPVLTATDNVSFAGLLTSMKDDMLLTLWIRGGRLSFSSARNSLTNVYGGSKCL